MPTRINHIAIVSDDFALEGTFYAAIFGLRGPSDPKKSSLAVNLTDGYVGLNINPRKPGRQSGLDHFGFEVEDVEALLVRASELYPACEHVKRPSNRPFAAVSMHDPAGNIFDLSQIGLKNRDGVYADKPIASGPSRVSHIVVRTLRAQECADFYRDVFELAEDKDWLVDPLEGTTVLTDGEVRLVITPWTIGHFFGTGIARPAIDHVGFEVKSLEEFKSELTRIVTSNPTLTPRVYANTPESYKRVEQTAAWGGDFQLADPDGVLLDVRQAG